MQATASGGNGGNFKTIQRIAGILLILALFVVGISFIPSPFGREQEQQPQGTAGEQGLTDEEKNAAAGLGDAGMNLAYWLALMSISISILLMFVQNEGLGRSFSKLLQTCLLFAMFATFIRYGGQWIQ